MGKQFNGTTLTFDAVLVGGITGITFAKNAVEVEVADIDAAMAEYEAGQLDVNLSVTVVGAISGTLDVGDTGAILISWNDGSTDPLTNSVIMSRGPGGTKNGAIATTYTFRPAPAAA